VTTPEKAIVTRAMTIWMTVWLDPATVEQPGGGRQQTGADGAPQAGDQVDADDVERVVVAEAVLQADGQAAEPPATTPRIDRAERGQGAAGRGDRDQAGDDAGGGAEEVAWPSRSFSTSSQPSIAAAVATVVLTQARPAVPSAPAPSRR
jgi:hypothetical protein